MNKYLPPSEGLWYLGDQCGSDLYELLDHDTGEVAYLDVFFLTNDPHPDDVYPGYVFGMFHGLNEYEVEAALSNMPGLKHRWH